MGLTNSQYDQIMRSYSRDQAAQRRLLESRRARIYGEIPALATLDEQVASCAVSSAISGLDGNTKGSQMERSRMHQLMDERRALLQAHGFSPEDLQMGYVCPECQDTGYVNGRKCRCFYRRAVDLFYTQSGLRQALEKENFSTFTLEYYDDTRPDPQTGLTPRQNMEQILETCLKFIEQFDESAENLLFFGGTGLGKTFLSNCIAKELIESAHSVIYYSAQELFDSLSSRIFGSEQPEEKDPFSACLTDCDLLIIDDLGTEMTNSFVSTRLFFILNQRLSRNRSTIISTNLSLGEFANAYSERVFSRISSQFTLLGFRGDDIRIAKKLQEA